MPKKVTTLGLLAFCVTLCNVGANILDAPSSVTNIFLLVGLLFTAIEKFGAK